MGYIYKITNKLNNKVYLGVTLKSVKIRWIQHKSDAKNGAEFPLHRAIRKYGAENFLVETLEIIENKDEIYKREIELIANYDSANSQKGYNASKGGEHSAFGVVSHLKGKTKENSEILARISISQTGKDNSFFGKKHSEESRQKMSKTRTGKKLGKRPDLVLLNKNKIWSEEAKDKISKSNSKPIKCLNDGIVYPSITSACKTLFLDQKSVINVLKGKFKQTKGYVFEYVTKAA